MKTLIALLTLSSLSINAMALPDDPIIAKQDSLSTQVSDSDDTDLDTLMLDLDQTFGSVTLSSQPAIGSDDILYLPDGSF